MGGVVNRKELMFVRQRGVVVESFDDGDDELKLTLDRTRGSRCGCRIAK